MLNPLLREFTCGCVILHHTNKPPTGRDKPDWQAGDFAYMGSGSIEWAGWPRASIVLRSMGSQTVYELRAGKRGARLRWKEPDGETKAFAKLIAQSKEEELIYWRYAEDDERPEEPRAKRASTKEDLMPHVPTDKPILKEALRSKANAADIAMEQDQRDDCRTH